LRLKGGLAFFRDGRGFIQLSKRLHPPFEGDGLEFADGSGASEEVA
jgi:hypothetical protein